MTETGAARRRRAYHWLAALPALCMLGGVPWANRIEPYVLGLPLLLFWILLWVVVTSGIMALIYALDEAAARRAAGEPGGGAATSPTAGSAA